MYIRIHLNETTRLVYDTTLFETPKNIPDSGRQNPVIQNPRIRNPKWKPLLLFLGKTESAYKFSSHSNKIFAPVPPQAPLSRKTCYTSL